MRALILICLLLPTMVFATPPQIVGVREALFGISDTHLFVLRTTRDNLGLHQPTQTDVLLVARNRQTNRDEDIWPVLRTLDHGVNFIEDGYSLRVETLPLAGWTNPFDVLIATAARPLVGISGRTIDDYRIEWINLPDTVELFDDRSATFHHLAFTEITAQFTENLNFSRDTIPAYFIEGEGRGGIDMLRGVPFDPAQDCTFDRLLPISEMAEDFETHWLLKVTCSNGTTMADMSMHLFTRASKTGSFLPPK